MEKVDWFCNGSTCFSVLLLLNPRARCVADSDELRRFVVKNVALRQTFAVNCLHLFSVPHDIGEIIKIQAPRIVPERADLTLECELQVHDEQELSINWYFSEIKTPVQVSESD